MFLVGCAEDHDAHHHTSVDTYRSGTYAETGPTYVERRTVFVDNADRQVPVYRTGNAYYYTYGGRRYDLSERSYSRTGVASTRTVRTRDDRDYTTNAGPAVVAERTSRGVTRNRILVSDTSAEPSDSERNIPVVTTDRARVRASTTTRSVQTY
jgi:hypothetical protein